MKLVSQFSIKNKLILIILGISSFTIILTLVINFIGDIENYKENLVSSAQTNASIIGESCAAPIIFGYSNEISEILGKLSSVQYVLNASVYNNENILYGSFNRTNELQSPVTENLKEMKTHFDDEYLIVVNPINYEGEFYGTVYMIVSTSGLKTKIKNSVLVIIIMILGSIIVSYLLAVYFQKLISKPILYLTDITNTIAQKNDYSIRVEPTGNDEITDLYKRFNYMFEVIQAKEKERNKALEEVENLNRHLEQKVIERTKELENAKIVAEKASITKSELLSNISHELRTPLNIINGNNQILISRITQPKLKKMSFSIDNSVRQLISMVNNIISFSETESGNIAIELSDFSIELVFKCLEQYYAKSIIKKGLQYNSSIDENIPATIKGDANQLLRVLFLLVDNAIKFTETGSIFIEAKYVHTNENKCRIGFTVKDTGIGIAADKIESLFNSISQIDGSTTRKYGGIGIGLTLCKRIITNMNGTISVNSELGIGSSFYVELDFMPSGKMSR